MGKRIGLLGIVILGSFLAGAPSHRSQMLLDDYRDGLDPRWEKKCFRGEVDYRAVRGSKDHYIRAVSNGGACALVYEIEYDPKQYPIIRWRWRVDRAISKGDGTTKQGDDYVARVYVVFPSLFLVNTRAINYVWANKLPMDTPVPNPHYPKSIMVALERGNKRAGKWVAEERNVLEDYRNYFQEDPPEVGAIAIMTDTDNTGEQAVAHYGPIRVLSDSSS